MVCTPGEKVSNAMSVQRFLLVAIVVSALTGCANRPTVPEELPRHPDVKNNAPPLSTENSISTKPVRQQDRARARKLKGEGPLVVTDEVEMRGPYGPSTAERLMPPLPRGKSWELIWSEEFQGQNLDLSKWTIRTGPHRDGYWTEDAVHTRW